MLTFSIMSPVSLGQHSKILPDMQRNTRLPPYDLL